MAFSDFGSSIIKALTGTDPATLQAEVNAAQDQITLAIETMITLQLVGDALLLLLVIMAFKNRRA